MAAEFTSHEDHECIRISLLFYLGFVVTPNVNTDVVIFFVKTLFIQLGSEDGGCMFFYNVGTHVLDPAVM